MADLRPNISARTQQRAGKQDGAYWRRTQKRQLMFASANYATRPQQFLYFFPLPQGQGSLRPTFGPPRRTGRSIAYSPFSGSSARGDVVGGFVRTPAGRFAVPVDAPSDPAPGAVSFNRNCGSVARKFSNACRFEVLRKRLCNTSFLMFAISSTNMS